MKERYMILIALMLLFVVIFFTVTGNIVKHKQKQIVDLDNKIKTTQEKLNSARIMDQQLSQFAIIIDNSLTKSPSFSFDEVNAFKTEMGKLADQRSITINKLSDANKFSLPGLIETTFTVELEASYIQLGQFISDLESLDNILKIHSFDISPTQATTKDKEKTAGPNRYKMSLELSIFKVKKEV